MKKRVVVYIVFGLFACLVASLMVNYWQYRDARDRPDKVEVRIDTVYTERTDTAPSQVSESQVAVVSVPVKNVSENDGNVSSDTADVSNGSLEVVGDSVRIPITQKVYEDSLYTAYVSGYMQSLDSITIRERNVLTTVTKTYTETEFRRWNIGITTGYGYGIRERKPDFFVGVGLTYNIFPNRKKRK